MKQEKMEKIRQINRDKVGTIQDGAGVKFKIGTQAAQTGIYKQGHGQNYFVLDYQTDQEKWIVIEDQDKEIEVEVVKK